MAINQTVADLEEERGLKLFLRAKRVAQLTPEGESFARKRCARSRRLNWPLTPRFELILQELTTIHQDAALDKGLIEIGFTRMLNRTGLFHRFLFDISLASVIKQLFPRVEHEPKMTQIVPSLVDTD